MSLSWSIDRRILCTQGDLERREPEGLGRLGQDFRSARQAPPSPQPRTGSKLICDHSGQRETPMKTTDSRDSTLRWELFIRQRVGRNSESVFRPTLTRSCCSSGHPLRFLYVILPDGQISHWAV